MIRAEAKLTVSGLKHAIDAAKLPFPLWKSQHEQHKRRLTAKEKQEVSKRKRPMSTHAAGVQLELKAYYDRVCETGRVEDTIEGGLKRWRYFASDLPEGFYITVCVDALKALTDFPPGIQALCQEHMDDMDIEIDIESVADRRHILQAALQSLDDDKEAFLKTKRRKTTVYSIEDLRTADIGTFTGRSSFKCRGGDKSIMQVYFKHDRSLLRVWDQFERRTLSFHNDGIDVLDEAGQKRNLKTSQDGPSIPRDQLEQTSENVKWLSLRASDVTRTTLMEQAMRGYSSHYRLPVHHE